MEFSKARRFVSAQVVKKNCREVKNVSDFHRFTFFIIIIWATMLNRRFAERVDDSGKTDFSHYPASRIFTPINGPASILLSSDNIILFYYNIDPARSLRARCGYNMTCCTQVLVYIVLLSLLFFDIHIYNIRWSTELASRAHLCAVRWWRRRRRSGVE